MDNDKPLELHIFVLVKPTFFLN